LVRCTALGGPLGAALFGAFLCGTRLLLGGCYFGAGVGAYPFELGSDLFEGLLSGCAFLAALCSSFFGPLIGGAQLLGGRGLLGGGVGAYLFELGAQLVQSLLGAAKFGGVLGGLTRGRGVCSARLFAGLGGRPGGLRGLAASYLCGRFRVALELLGLARLMLGYRATMIGLDKPHHR
jgi:hypothetical protein